MDGMHTVAEAIIFTCIRKTVSHICKVLSLYIAAYWAVNRYLLEISCPKIGVVESEFMTHK